MSNIHKDAAIRACDNKRSLQDNAKGLAVQNSCRDPSDDSLSSSMGHSASLGGNFPTWIACRVLIPSKPGGAHGLANLLTWLVPFLYPNLPQYTKPLYICSLWLGWTNWFPTWRNLSVMGFGLLWLKAGTLENSVHALLIHSLKSLSSALKLLLQILQVYLPKSWTSTCWELMIISSTMGFNSFLANIVCFRCLRGKFLMRVMILNWIRLTRE